MINKILKLQQKQTHLPPTASVIHLCSVDALKVQIFYENCKMFPIEENKPY